MFYHFLYPLSDQFSALNIFRYITFRTIYGGLTAFLICFLMGPWVIRRLQLMQIGQIIQTDGPQSHMGKQGTPTMGGILILFSIFVTTLLWGNLSNHYVTILLLAVLLFGFIGFFDDYLMQVKKRNMGFTAKGKFTIQILFGLIISYLIYQSPDFSPTLTVPFFKNFTPNLGLFYIPFACLVIVGHLQRRQPHRRPGRPGHRPLYRGLGHLYVFCLCGRPHPVCRVPSDAAHCCSR